MKKRGRNDEPGKRAQQAPQTAGDVGWNRVSTPRRWSSAAVARPQPTARPSHIPRPAGQNSTPRAGSRGRHAAEPGEIRPQDGHAAAPLHAHFQGRSASRISNAASPSAVLVSASPGAHPRFGRQGIHLQRASPSQREGTSDPGQGQARTASRTAFSSATIPVESAHRPPATHCPHNSTPRRTPRNPSITLGQGRSVLPPRPGAEPGQRDDAQAGARSACSSRSRQRSLSREWPRTNGARATWAAALCELAGGDSVALMGEAAIRDRFRKRSATSRRSETKAPDRPHRQRQAPSVTARPPARAAPKAPPPAESGSGRRR